MVRTIYFTVLTVSTLCVSLSVVSDSLQPRGLEPPGSSVHGILQARTLEWVAIPSPRGILDPGTEPSSPALQADCLLSDHQEGPSTCFFKIKELNWG